MRLCYPLLAIAASLLATCNAVAEDSKVSQLNPSDTPLLIQQFARTKTDNAEKRSLRSKRDDEDSTELYKDGEGEERGPALNPIKALRKLLKNKKHEQEIEKKAITAVFGTKANFDIMHRGQTLGRQGRSSPNYESWRKYKKLSNKG
ncbi:hypothetical protein PHYBOEH_004386 [Phytophthora boehmeriae]|uniref:RxLR effector protein n=1 Tax=Phytophthora boehmeriae TaxID=109152 RepID=A0A8T1WR13_9STRA|nr:hypothetical protein PHYBOEH_004386 [Phytophthora boehmeriae]